MSRKLALLLFVSLATSFLMPSAFIAAQEPAASPKPRVKTVELTPETLSAEVGQQIKCTAVAKDESGKVLDLQPTVWFAAPFDVGSADMSGIVNAFSPGELRVGVMIGGKVGYSTITVKPARVAKMEIDSVPALVVGGATRLNVTARTKGGDPRSEVAIKWESDAPAVATVDAAGVVTGIKAGRATIRATADGTAGSIGLEVVPNPVHTLSIEPRSANARTGDVVRFRAKARNAAGAQLDDCAVRWAVGGEGAMIESDGGFVAEKAGTYLITGAVGNKTAVASIVVTPRNMERDIEVIGRAKLKGFQASEQWIIGNHAYVSSISDKLLVYDISNPAEPRLTDTIQIDARILNDVSTTADG
ncbi:MAG TPA: Ig-like domain-containing protein, partial [Blastocatellia bacterium]|nr:Ig-like domain-containing protein [Blastocatellia bacterium]